MIAEEPEALDNLTDQLANLGAKVLLEEEEAKEGLIAILNEPSDNTPNVFGKLRRANIFPDSKLEGSEVIQTFSVNGLTFKCVMDGDKITDVKVEETEADLGTDSGLEERKVKKPKKKPKIERRRRRRRLQGEGGDKMDFPQTRIAAHKRPKAGSKAKIW